VVRHGMPLTLDGDVAHEAIPFERQ
jgi:hypothetical protein